MISKNILISIAVVLAGCAAPKGTGTGMNTVSASNLMPIGRTAINEKLGLELISSASNFGFRFSGKQCQLFVTINNPSGHSYLQYEMDGVYQKRLRVDGNTTAPITIMANAEGVHTVWIYKATEAQTGPIFISKITGHNIKALPQPKAPMIEFIGNSITCGAASDPSEIACNKGEYHDQHNAYMAYGPRVARALKTNFMLSSISGYGIYRNWNSDGPTLPMVYEKTRLVDTDTTRWNFSTYNPRIVSIALGTNDYSNGDGKHKRLAFDSASFVNKYIQFVQLVKSKYPHSQLLLLSSAMVHDNKRTTLQNCLTAVKKSIDDLYPNDKPVATYFFKQMNARGCGGHPNVEDHAILADELLPVYKRLL